VALLPKHTIANAELYIFPNYGREPMVVAKHAFESIGPVFLIRRVRWLSTDT